MTAFVIFILKTVALAAISWAIGQALKKDPEFPDAEPSDFDAPTIREGATYGVVFGMPKRISNPKLAWWGHVAKVPIIAKPLEGDKYIKGHRYRMGMHHKLCHGPIDGIKQIWVGEKILWPNKSDRTEIASDGQVSILVGEWGFHTRRGLFGGDKNYGGIKGMIDIQYGYSTQTVNSYLSGQLGSNISASRGLVGVIFNRIYIGTSPYPRRWSFLPKRTDLLGDGSPQWYIAKADISNDLNPAHFLRECYTNTEWGDGQSVSLFDDTVWEAFADDLYDEGFGLSRLWDEPNENLQDLINDVLRHIDGKVYQDPETGMFVPVLARDDYVVDDLDTYDETDIAEVFDYVQPFYDGNVPDRVNVRITDVIHNKVVPIPAQDMAILDIQGGNSNIADIDFLAITKPALGGKVAARELLKITAMPAMMKIKAKRTMGSLRPFSVFKLSWPKAEIVSMVIRVINANYGKLDDGYVIYECIQDVFAMQDAIFAAPPDSGWSDPESDPVAAPYRLLIEAPFWVLAKIIGVSLAQALDDDAGFLLVSATAPSDDAFDYELLVRDSLTADFESEGSGPFTPTATIDANLPMDAVDVEIDLSNFEYPENIIVGSYAQINDELVKVLIVDYDDDLETLSVTVARGVLDTVPDSHSADDRIWFVGSVGFFVDEEYTATDQPGTKILPCTAIGQLLEADAPIDNATAFDSRMIRPYPPGNFKIDGLSYPIEFSGEPVLTWTHRDRTQQTQSIIEHDNVSIGPEAGTTYTIKIYDSGDTLRTTVTGLTGVTYTYAAATEVADCGSIQTQLRFVLYAVRDGYDSWQVYDITVLRQVSLAGTAAASSSASGTMSRTIPLAGEVYAFSNVSGELKSFSLEGFVVAESGASGAITMELGLKGQVDAQGGASGDLTVP